MESSWVVEVSEGVEHQYLEALARLFEVCFEPVRGNAAFAESRDPVHFVQLVAHPSMRCFIAFDSANEPIGFTAVTNNIRRIGWIEARFYEQRFPEATAEGRLYYFPYIFVHPSAQSSGVVSRLFDRVISVLAAERAVVGFDVSDVNVRLLHAFRSALKRAWGGSDAALVDTHSFYVVPLEGAHLELLSVNRTPATIEPR